MEIQLIRHTTMVITIDGQRLLVDPMLSPARSMAPVDNSPNMQPNPLVELPFPAESLYEMDALLVTHTHRDHFDAAAAELLPKSLPVLCQPPDAEKFTAWGFTDVRPVADSLDWNGLTLVRTGGQHGTGAIGQQMAPVSGYVIKRGSEALLYITGDTVWCKEVAKALKTYHPPVTIVYAGAAQFLTGDPITMAESDIMQLLNFDNSTQVVVAHMEAFNHCLLTRNELKDFLASNLLLDRVQIPQNGSTVNI